MKTMVFVFVLFTCNQPLVAQSMNESVLLIKKTEDFTLTGSGISKQWSRTDWLALSPRTGREHPVNHQTRVKILYSDSGLYVLFHCEDDMLSATIESDFEELWREDVVELFLWPDQAEPVYFEYQLSPLNYELAILVYDRDGERGHWIPFEFSYKDGRRTRHQTSVAGGEKQSGASVESWMAEIYIPFELLQPLKNSFPESGTTWRANMYRVDYDNPSGPVSWVWQQVRTNFHDYKRYGTFLFE